MSFKALRSTKPTFHNSRILVYYSYYTGMAPGWDEHVHKFGHIEMQRGKELIRPKFSKKYKKIKKLPPYLLSNWLFHFEILFDLRILPMTPHLFRPTSTTPSWQKQQGGAVAWLSFFFSYSRLFRVTWDGSRHVVSEMAWRCLFCAGFSALLLSSLLTHYNSEHYRCHEERNFNICCQIDGCTKMCFIQFNVKYVSNNSTV